MSSSSAASTVADRLQARLGILDEIGAIGAEGGRLPVDLASRVTATVANARGRLGHGTSHTVVALAGATGSGKSSLFNAITATSLADVGVRRPTTSQARAAMFGPGAGPLLDWLQVERRDELQAGELDGLVVLDLPDHDSTAAAHRLEVERLVQVVDVLCWVVDPQKYADAALHEGFLQRYAGHGAVTIVVLNQIDRLDPDGRRRCLAHLAELVRDDGLQGVRVIGASAATGEGVADLRRELGARTAERRALVARLDADLDWLAGDLAGSCGEADPTRVPRPARDALVAAAGRVAGVETVADAAARAYRHDASLAMGWPPVRWVRRLRADPLRRIGLRRRPGVPPPSIDAPGSSTLTVRRTSLPTPGAGELAMLAGHGRDLVSAATERFPEHWVTRVDQVVAPGMAALPDRLDGAIGSSMGSAAVMSDRPGWWSAAGVVQRLLSAAMAVGLVWLLGLFVLAWFRVPDPPTPELGAFPLPTVLAIGGGALGLLVASIGRRLAVLGAERRRRHVTGLLRAGVGDVVDATVVDPVDAELTALAHLGATVRALAR